jgi:hypothetical protein
MRTSQIYHCHRVQYHHHFNHQANQLQKRETEHSLCIYKQPEGSNTLSKFVERHMGIEALHVARQMLFEASKVYLQVEMDRHGQVSTPKDLHGRRLANVFLREKDNTLFNFADKRALSGHTLSFYTTCIDMSIDRAMRDAIKCKRGIFSLPEEIFTYPKRYLPTPTDCGTCASCGTMLTTREGMQRYDPF